MIKEGYALLSNQTILAEFYIKDLSRVLYLLVVSNMMPMQVSVQANGPDAVQINNFYCSAGAPLDGPAEPRAAHAQDLEAALAKCASALAQSETALAQSETALAQSETTRKDLAAALQKQNSNMQALDAECRASYEKYKDSLAQEKSKMQALDAEYRASYEQYKDSLAQKTEEMQAFREEARKLMREMLDEVALLPQLSQAAEIERVPSEIVSFQHGGARTCCAYKSGLSIFAIIVGLCIQLFLQARWLYR